MVTPVFPPAFACKLGGYRSFLNFHAQVLARESYPAYSGGLVRPAGGGAWDAGHASGTPSRAGHAWRRPHSPEEYFR
jgi:hypothetical protein